MAIKFKNTIEYILGVAPSQLKKDFDKSFKKDPSSHVLHGCLFPLMHRHHEIENNSNLFTALNKSMHLFLLKANFLSAQQRDILNFNIAAYSIELCRITLEKKGFFAKGDFEEFVSREWKSSYYCYKTNSQKTQLPHLISDLKEKESFLHLMGKREPIYICDQLYFQKNEVIKFILAKRKLFFKKIGDKTDPYEKIIWRWFFGSDKDELFLEVRTEFSDLLNTIKASTRTLYNHDNSSASQNKNEERYENKEASIITECPSCLSPLRLILPFKGTHGKCKKCNSRFVIITGNQGEIHLEPAPVDDQTKTNEEILRAFHILGLDEASTKEQIRSAYRKKISEYHPDKVNGLGAKLKSLAEEESKMINLAVGLLKKTGHL
jgi:hypothetical protein